MNTTQNTESNWMSPRNAPEKVQVWAAGQLVQVVQSNEVFDRWLRMDGQKLVVRR